MSLECEHTLNSMWRHTELTTIMEVQIGIRLNTHWGSYQSPINPLIEHCVIRLTYRTHTLKLRNIM